MKKILLSLAAFFMICCTVCAQKKEKQILLSDKID